MTSRRPSRQELDRRDFLRLLAGSAAVAGVSPALYSCAGKGTGKKVVVLGLDGLDPNLLQGLIDTGRAPNFAKLAQLGSFRPLATTMPALSPVAWSSFITGLTPGGHGIGDFIMRDPDTYLPVFSIYESTPVTRTLSLGQYELPVSGGEQRSMRRGRPFWSWLKERGIPSYVAKIPTNFPVDEHADVSIGGMGTPDLADAYGMFNFFTTDPWQDFPDLSGGYVQYVELHDDVLKSELIGPPGYAAPGDGRKDPHAGMVKAPFELHLDRQNEAARLVIGDHSVVLTKGDFSDWVPVEFEVLPVVGKVSGIARFLLQEVGPHVRLYVTPINIDPSNQAAPVTFPEEYGAELAHEIGPWGTKGLPGDTKAFDQGVFKDEDYVKQAEYILQERMAMFDYAWSRFDEGFFYFYVSNTDQDAHMLWRNMDPTHPMHKESDVRFSGYLHHLYEEMDRLVGRVLPAVDDDTLLLVCSDHGFAQFGRQFHLNTWLRDNGFLTLKESAQKKEVANILDVDWKRTYAYGLGFNGLYLNLKGREKQGVVDPGSSVARQIQERLTTQLQGLKDDETGRQPIHKVYRRDDLYTGAQTPDMPELLVGWTPGYRNASSSVVGETGKATIDLNPWAWSGDHSMSVELIPGVLFSSKPLRKQLPSILDLPVTILEWFGIDKPEEMVGGSIFT